VFAARSGSATTAVGLRDDARRDRGWARDGSRALSASDGDGEAGHGEAETSGRTLNEAALRKREEGTTDSGFVLAHTHDHLVERGGGATAGEAEEGAEDVDLEAHEVSLRSALNTRPLKGVDFDGVPGL
jgi:hypothetical protein